MATFTSKATGNWNATGQTTWNEVGSPIAGDTVTIQTTHNVTLTANAAAAILTIDAGGTFTQSTYNMTLTGFFTVDGTWIAGVSSGTGLIAVGIDIGSTASVDLQTLSVIENSGEYNCGSIGLFVNNYRGSYTQTGTADIYNPFFNNLFYNFTLNELDSGLSPITFTLIGNAWLGSIGSNDILINGIIAVGGSELIVGCDTSGSITMGANSDVTGTAGGEWTFSSLDGTFTNNKTTAFTFNQDVRIAKSNSIPDLTMVAWDFSNANMLINGSNTWGHTRIISAGTLKCVDFSIITSSTNDLTLDNVTYDPDFEISGTINLNVTALATITYDKGATETIKLTGTAQSIDLDGLTVGNIFSSSSIGAVTIIAGDTWDIDTLGLTTAALTVNGTFKGGITAVTGLSCSSLTFASGSTADLQIETKIDVSGNTTISTGATFTNDGRGTFRQVGSGTFTNDSLTKSFYRFTQLFGTLTLGSSTKISSNTFVASGIININGNTLTLSGSVTFNGSFDILGSAPSVLRIISLTSFTQNKASDFTFSGLISNETDGTDIAIHGLYPNANYRLYNTTAGSGTLEISGNLECNDFTIENSASGNIVVINSTNNPSFIFNGNVDYNTASGTLTYTKGNGTVTFNNTISKTLDADGQTLEDIVKAGSGITEIVGNFTTESLSGSAGTLRSTVAGTEITITATNKGVASNVTFKDIHMNASNKVNAKNSSVNLGNTKGIVFTDFLKFMI